MPSAGTALNVLQIGTQFGVGGITRHILALRGWLKKRGHQVWLAGTPDVWAGPETIEDFLPLSTRFVASDGGALINRLRHTAQSAITLRRWLRRNRVDLIHAHESAPALVANLARRGLQIPLALTYHGSEPSRIAGFGKIARQCDMVITPSENSARDLIQIGGIAAENVRVIGLGVERAPEIDAVKVAQLRAQLLGDGERLIVTIARLIHQKGIDVLIKCVAAMKISHPQFRFVVAGDGPDEAKLKQRAAQRNVDTHLNFVGRTSAPHLYLRAADLFLLTSRWEALPFTIVEAFQAGTPAVATACSGVVELIDDDVGAVARIGDVAHICEQVADVLSDENRRKALGPKRAEPQHPRPVSSRLGAREI